MSACPYITISRHVAREAVVGVVIIIGGIRA
jgi:hypothetical protein